MNTMPTGYAGVPGAGENSSAGTKSLYCLIDALVPRVRTHKGGSRARDSIVHGLVCIALLSQLFSGAVQAEAVILHESATLGVESTGGWGVGLGQFLGSRFYVDSFVQVTGVGGHLFSSGGQLFAAIVQLDGPDAVPSGSPFNETLLATATFDARLPSTDVRTPLSVTLAPGWYGLIFGSGMFGATGSGGMPGNNSDTPGRASYFCWTASFQSWHECAEVSNVRFVVEGQIVGETADFSISPPSGRYLRSQHFELGLIVEASGLSVVSKTVILDGVDVTGALRRCVPGTLPSGGQTFRCPLFRRPGPGTHSLRVILELSNGARVSDVVTWEILGNSERWRR